MNASRPPLNATKPQTRKIQIIAHRGASGYLPEHTLEAKALAHGLGADYVEQDVVLTKDAVPIVVHDIQLDHTTDVRTRFPGRESADGMHYAIDFTLNEIQQLRVTERRDHATGQAVFPSRFPVGLGRFRIPTLAEEIALISGLNKSTQRNVGFYIEIKSPQWHRSKGYDITAATLRVLSEFSIHGRKDPAWIQCFDSDELTRIRNIHNCDIRLCQLIGENSWNEAPCDYTQMLAPSGLAAIAKYADAIAPWIPQVMPFRGKASTAACSDLTARAHDNGLAVHPYTVRLEELPDGVTSFGELHARLLEAEVDGLFTDFPDLSAALLGHQRDIISPH